MRAARKGLTWHEFYGRGGTRIGLIRANQLVQRKNLSVQTIRRMYSFFKRHYQNRETDPEYGNGQIAWLLWGGDPGFRWVTRVLKKEGYL